MSRKQISKGGRNWPKGETLLDPKPLIERIEATGMSLWVFCKRSGIPTTQPYEWRRGRCRVTLMSADQVCVALDVPLLLVYPDER